MCEQHKTDKQNSQFPLQINRAYRCTEHCKRPTDCQNGGYPNPHNCAKCKCPAGLGGAKCTEVQFSVCGAKLQVSVFV